MGLDRVAGHDLHSILVDMLVLLIIRDDFREWCMSIQVKRGYHPHVTRIAVLHSMQAAPCNLPLQLASVFEMSRRLLMRYWPRKYCVKKRHGQAEGPKQIT